MSFKLYHNGDPFRGGHRDLHFEIPALGVKDLYDSYYYLDNKGFEVPESFLKDVASSMKYILQKYLDQLLVVIRNIKVFDEKFIPIGLYDEYTTVLNLKRLNNRRFEMSFGWVRINGFGVSVSDINSFQLGGNTYNMDTKIVIVQEEKIIASLKESIQNIQNTKIIDSSPKNILPSKGVTFIYKNEEE